MKVRRDIAAIPKRSAAETWRVIVDLVTGSGSVDAETLTAAASVLESLIADEWSMPGRAGYTMPRENGCRRMISSSS